MCHVEQTIQRLRTGKQKPYLFQEPQITSRVGGKGLEGGEYTRRSYRLLQDLSLLKGTCVEKLEQRTNCIQSDAHMDEAQVFTGPKQSMYQTETGSHGRI